MTSLQASLANLFRSDREKARIRVNHMLRLSPEKIPHASLRASGRSWTWKLKPRRTFHDIRAREDSQDSLPLATFNSPG